jgi:hypothetical protein
VVNAGEIQQLHFLLSRVKVRASQLSGQGSTAYSVVFVGVFVKAPGVMEKRKQLNHMDIGTCVLSQHQSVGTDTGPVSNAMVSPPIND